MSMQHLTSNAQSGNFEAAVQLFLNYYDGLNGFEKNRGLAENSFTSAVQILNSDFYLNELNITNFKKIQELKIDLNKNLTVFIGENGIGKTSLLEAIRKNLMWIAATTRKENTAGGRIDEDEVNNIAKQSGLGAYIDCEFQIGNIYKCKGRVARAPEGIISDLKSELTKYRELGRNLRILNDYKDINLPLFSFYGIDRLQKGSLKSKSLTFGKIDGYDDSLNSKTSFDIFVEWLIQLLKISNVVVNSTERIKIQSQVNILLNTGANDKNSPLYEVYEDLVSVLNLYPDEGVKTKSQRSIEYLELLFREIYPNLIKIQLINNDDGNDKVALQLDDQIIYLHQFSDGQRVLLGLIGDIARRLILLNDTSERPLEGHGIVLIDEIELHLHPKWQQKAILILQKSFPNIQFIVTTHSPHILSTVDKNSIYIINSKHEVEHPTFQTKGVGSADVLERIMGTFSEPEIPETKQLNEYFGLVKSNNYKTDYGDLIFSELLQHFGMNHPLISQIKTQIKILEIRNKFKKGD